MSFFHQIYQIVKQIPKGKVMTYGQIAKILGTPDARRVGWALHANSDPLVPCHRVVNKAGRLAPKFAFGGEDEQKKRLEKEGIIVKENRVDLKKFQILKFEVGSGLPADR
jgi:methylated-DNA-protein-cysteine methyltransferase related protein